jgi:esterase/lipase
MNFALREKFRPPGELLHLSEPLRAMSELALLPMAESWLSTLRGGDGHPVIVIPGFTVGDRSTVVLRKFLASLGYLPSGWKQGVNFGVRTDAFAGVSELLAQLHAEYGCRISLVGQSLGGIYARELAKVNPDAVRQVITLGSPFNDPEGDGSNLSDLYRMFNPAHAEKSAQFRQQKWEIGKPPPVPTTAVYSKLDGVCHWRACIQHGGHDQVENIEVTSSHTGMSVNAQTLFVVADRLAQRRKHWKPFHIGHYFGLAPI